MNKNINGNILAISIVLLILSTIEMFILIGLIGMVDTYYTVTQNQLQTISEQLIEQNETIQKYNEQLTNLENNMIIKTEEIGKGLTITSSLNETVTLFTLDNSTRWDIGEDVSLPNMPSDMKLCTDYRCYNIDGTPHKRLQEASYTDELGCRRYNDDYCVALGSFYSDRIGDRFEVTLDTGVTFTVITADMKADIHTDESNRYHPCVNYDGEDCANVLEFIIDTDVLPNEVYAYGSLGYYDYFKGDVIKMTYLGRDTSGDWDTYN